MTKQKSQEKKTQSDDTGQKSEKTKKLLEDLQSGRVTASLGKMPISFNLDPENTVYLTPQGQFYLSVYRGLDKQGEERWDDTLKFTAPLHDLSLIKQGENWKIRYTFDNDVRQDSIDTMLSFLANKLKLDTGSTKLFAQFLYKFKTHREENKEFEIFYEPVAVVDGVIKINRIADQPTEEILKTLIDLHEISTHPDSFFTSLLYNVVSPFSYEIRYHGQKFPYRLLSGRTHGGKTSEQFLLTLKGFDQPIKDRKESLNTIKTIFTLGQEVEKSRLPLVVDDINNEWLKFHSEELKGGTDGVKFMARGTRAQTQIVYEMLGMPIFTMNQEPVIPLALKDRIIMSLFTEENQQRQNKKEFEKFSDQLKPGFMFNILKETMEGKTIPDLLNDIHKSVKTDSEINQRIITYVHNLLKGLAERYNIEIPDCPKLDSGNAGYDLLETFCIYVATRYNSKDRDGTTYQKFCPYYAKKEGEKDEMRITTEGFNDFKNTHKELKLDTMVDFINEVKNPEVQIKKPYLSALRHTAQCIVVPMVLILQEIKEAEKKLTDEDYRSMMGSFYDEMYGHETSPETSPDQNR